MNPLNQKILERTPATYFITFIVNQLFTPDHDVVELGWLEREFFASKKSKWDGVLFKVGNKSCSSGSIEFSGECNDRTPNSKKLRDITKLYSKLLEIINTQRNSAKEQTFCMRYYGKITVYLSMILCSMTIPFFLAENCIYFEKLTKYNDLMLRSVHATILVPNSPRKVVKYVDSKISWT